MADYLGGYAPRGNGNYWSPLAMSAPAAAPPAMVNTRRPVTAARPARVQDQRVLDPDISSPFGVKSGAFGSGPFGVKTGAFGNYGDDAWHSNNYAGYGGGYGGMTPASGGGGGGGGYGGGSVGGGGGAFDLASEYQRALDQANAANEARYKDILGGYQSRYERGLGLLDGMGQQEGRDINELYDNQAAQQRQSLVGRGLGNSTVLDTMLAGVDRERAADLGRLNERMRQQTLATDSGLSGDTLQFMERKTETGPDFNMLAQLAQQMGQAGYGAGGGGGFGGGGVGGGGGAGFGIGDSPSYFIPGASMGYMPRGGGAVGGGGSGDARLAAAAAIRRLANSGTASANPGTRRANPVSPEYARSWLPTFGGGMAGAPAGLGDMSRSGQVWYDPDTGEYVPYSGGFFGGGG